MRIKGPWIPAASGLLGALLFASPVYAISIMSEVQSLGGSTYRSVYSVTNDGSLGSGIAVELFDILFDLALYAESSLTIVTPAPLSTEWDELILGSAPGVPAAFDAFALAGGIPEGATASGFAVEYEWLGLGTPGAQAFEIYDPNTFALLETGSTTEAPSAQVPEPSALWMLAIGLTGLIGISETRRLRA
jgi:hypothetical protein